MLININPEKERPEGSYFGIIVTDGYDWGQCYSYAWEIKTYFNDVGVYESFPDINWDEDSAGVMHQCIAIDQELAEMPEPRFFRKEVIEDRK